MKKLTCILVGTLLLFSLTACGGKEDGDGQKSGRGGDGQNAIVSGSETVQEVDPDAPAHEQLLAQAVNYVTDARQKTDVGLNLQGEYFYGQAQASVSGLRYAIDYILWLMGEGETLADVTAGAPYRDWDSIVAAGMGSPAPYYFEGLVFEVQGKTAEADACYKRARANPTYEEMDFYYLRNMSIDELYALRETILTAEIAIYEEYTPRTVLCSTQRTGAEYSPTYHLALATKAAENDNAHLAWSCALNALLTNPTQAELYGAAVSYGLEVSDEEAVEILNEGLFVFPDDPSLNYFAGALALSAGDTAAAKDFLTIAETGSEGDLKAMCQDLLAQAGG